MKQARKILKLSSEDFYETHLRLMNVLLNSSGSTLTDKEIKLLTIVLNYSGDLKLYPFDTTSRKILIAKLRITKSGLSNYLDSLHKKGFIIEDAEGRTIINPVIVPGDLSQEYLIKLEKDDK